ncbi:MAG: hypothetical protein KZQ91_11010 [Candidatus Thiodiazotropha sp. (ex Lucinoma borealis)]|nr:hypothetical protein [Candidatus Thiodiazotropha sp. (ex Lucinoma borealis)]
MTLRPYAMTPVYLIGLLALSFLIHQDVLSGYWRFDDGWLLDFSSRFSPWDYFLNPAITRGYSLNNLTPFNPFIYDLNLWLFGLSPKGFYFQHLTTLTGCAIASFFLLRLWTPPHFAFLGAAAFLVGAPTLFVAQQLMVGHYIAGLFFSILAIYTYLISLDRRNWWLVALATLFYLLATTCKEIYFPLPFVLLFFQRDSFTTRLYHAIPMISWSVCYLIWRLIALGSFVGGYDSGGQAFSIVASLQVFSTIPFLLFGAGYRGLAATLFFLALLGYAVKNRVVNLPLLTIGLLAVALPLVPLTNYPGITQPNRYLLLPWWLISMTLAVTLARTPALTRWVKLLTGSLFIAAAALHGWQEQNNLQPKLDRFDATYDLFLKSTPETIFYSEAIKDAYYLDTVMNGARKTQARLDGKKAEHVGIIVHKGSLPLVDTTHHTIRSYDDACRCMRDITKTVPATKPQSSTKKPNILIVAITPPYPPLFEFGEGRSRLTQLPGAELRIDGQAMLPARDLEHELILITPKRPKRYKITALSQPDETLDSSSFEFQLTLYYSDQPSARYAADRSCLLIRSTLTPLQILPSDNQPACKGLSSTSQ